MSLYLKGGWRFPPPPQGWRYPRAKFNENTPDQPPLTFSTAAGTRYYIAITGRLGASVTLDTVPNLIQNGGFDKGISNWVIRSQPTTRLNDKLNCQKMFLLYETCYFNFNGGAGENSTLKQTLQGAKLVGWSFAAGQTYTFSAVLYASSGATTPFKGVITYADGTTQTFEAVGTPVIGSSYTNYYAIDHDITLNRGDVTKLEVSMNYKAQGKTAYLKIDNVALILTADAPLSDVRGEGLPLPLPAVPDGFRQ